MIPTEKPSRELDTLIAEAMGYELCESLGPGFMWFGGVAVPIPRYSTNIAAAWDIVRHLREYPIYEKFSLQGCVDRSVFPHGVQVWRCDFGGAFEKGWVYVDGVASEVLAICLAGLKALEYLRKEN